MDSRMKTVLAILVALLVVILLFVVLNDDKADASVVSDEPCTEVITVVDEEAYTEEIVHPAVYETVHHDAVTETTPAVWANWAPNNTQGPQDYVPVWPVDDRGTWIVHDQGIPPGHEGPDGVYQQGAGNSPWFYRQAETTVIVTPAYDEEVLVTDEYIEYVDHPEVSHEETVEVPCDDPTDPPNDPDDPLEPQNPNETNFPPKETSSQTVTCLGGALVTKTTFSGGDSSTSIVNASPKCSQVDQSGDFFEETG